MAITFSLLGDMGRLGNQLWQIASTVGIARTRGEKVCLPDWDYRPYFSCPDEWWGGTGKKVESTEYAARLHAPVRGYLQDISFWWDIRQEIWDAFQPSELAREYMQYPEYDEFWRAAVNSAGPASCALHVRRTDNVTNPKNTIKVVHPDYYLDAAGEIELLWGGAQHIRYCVFSDDIDWCGDNLPEILPGRDLLFVAPNYLRPKEHEPEYKTSMAMDWVDMQLMAACDHHIIANSTYSWWSAFLSADPTPRYPSYWLGTVITQHYDPDVAFPPNWVKVDARPLP